MTETGSETLLSVKDVAERIAASRYFVRSQIREGRLPVVRLGGGGRRMIRIRMADFETWLTGDQEEHDSERGPRNVEADDASS